MPLRFENLAKKLSRLTPSAGSAIVVGVDGGGGAGKSTFADRLSRAWEGSVVIHTDDFASWDNSLDWWPRLLEQTLIPLREGKPACYQRYDWDQKALAEWREVDSNRIILEGVSSTRSEFRPFLAYKIWIDCPRGQRLARGLERDGKDWEPYWQKWMADEDTYFSRDHPQAHADLIVNGDPGIGHREDEFELWGTGDL
jgi:uridine kinase